MVRERRQGPSLTVSRLSRDVGEAKDMIADRLASNRTEAVRRHGLNGAIWSANTTETDGLIFLLVMSKFQRTASVKGLDNSAFQCC